MLGHLQKRELGAAPLPRPPFKPPSGGVLVLEEGISLASLPFKPLDACSAALRYAGRLTQGVPGAPGDPLAPPSRPWAPSRDSLNPTENPPWDPLTLVPGTFG